MGAASNQAASAAGTLSARGSGSVAVGLQKVMAELKEGPLGRLEIKEKIGEGGYGVVHLGE